MGRSQETFNKKEVRNKKEKKRKEKAKKRMARREEDKKGMDDMIAYVDEYGNISDSPPDPDQKKEEVKVEDIVIDAANRNSGEEEDPVRKGTITFFNDSKGFGFIKDSETKHDVFVHINNATAEIKEGMLVSFEVENGPKGPTAVQVTPIK